MRIAYTFSVCVYPKRRKNSVNYFNFTMDSHHEILVKISALKLFVNCCANRINLNQYQRHAIKLNFKQNIFNSI